jgi:hypothetical protein
MLIGLLLHFIAGANRDQSSFGWQERFGAIALSLTKCLEICDF